MLKREMAGSRAAERKIQDASGPSFLCHKLRKHLKKHNDISTKYTSQPEGAEARGNE